MRNDKKRNDDGATLTEFGLLIGAIAIVVLSALVAFGGHSTVGFTKATIAMNTALPSSPAVATPAPTPTPAPISTPESTPTPTPTPAPDVPPAPPTYVYQNTFLNPLGNVSSGSLPDGWTVAPGLSVSSSNLADGGKEIVFYGTGPVSYLVDIPFSGGDGAGFVFKTQIKKSYVSIGDSLGGLTFNAVVLDNSGYAMASSSFVGQANPPLWDFGAPLPLISVEVDGNAYPSFGSVRFGTPFLASLSAGTIWSAVLDFYNLQMTPVDGANNPKAYAPFPLMPAAGGFGPVSETVQGE